MNSHLVLQSIQEQLLSIGYFAGLVQRDYDYADVSGKHYFTRQIPLAAFAQEPPSYRSACIGVTVSNGLAGAPNIAQHVALGAPLFFEVRPDAVDRWSLTGGGVAKFQERIAPSELPKAFEAHRAVWRPRDIFEAKTGVLRTRPSQLDFIDLGLLPALEGMVQEKLDALLKDTLAEVVATHRRVSNTPLEDRDLYKLLFRFVAAKVLRDRQQPGGWLSSDASVVLDAIEAYYGVGASALEPVNITDAATLAAAWDAISSKFFFQNLSVDDLAFIYENTFVTRETRRAFGTHSTPPHIAEFILRKLPLETVAVEHRRVLEPCSGHGVFLVSAMRRLRELLPASVGVSDRHEYLRERLVGIEVDPFALEVCRLNLVLADYPNPNGWQLHREDVFLTDRLASELPRADVVLCNPPFGLFDEHERQRYGSRLRRFRKPAQILLEVLERPPALLGFVLPKVFTSGRAYQEAHRRLADSYGTLELFALPDEVFEHADHETVLVLASDRREANTKVSVTCGEISQDFHTEFRTRLTDPPVVNDIVPVEFVQKKNFSLWIHRPPNVWRHLMDNPTLESLAVVQRGIQFLPGRTRSDVVSENPRDGWRLGFTTARRNLAQYDLARAGYINPDPRNMVGRPLERDWSASKVLANAKASSRGPWRLSAVTDETGTLATQAFHAVFPRGGVIPEVVAAILNGPIANAWLFAHEDKRDNRVATIKALPVPETTAVDHEAIAQRVQNLEELLAAGVETGARFPDRANALVLEIDALLLRAYGMPSELEAELLSLFGEHTRPLRFSFSGYGELFEQARSNIAGEEEQRLRLQRYQALVDQKYLKGLTGDQHDEMERLAREIDRYYAPFYTPIIQSLDQRLQERRGVR